MNRHSSGTENGGCFPRGDIPGGDNVHSNSITQVIAASAVPCVIRGSRKMEAASEDGDRPKAVPGLNRTHGNHRLNRYKIDRFPVLEFSAMTSQERISAWNRGMEPLIR